MKVLNVAGMVHWSQYQIYRTCPPCDAWLKLIDEINAASFLQSLTLSEALTKTTPLAGGPEHGERGS